MGHRLGGDLGRVLIIAIVRRSSADVGFAPQQRRFRSTGGAGSPSEIGPLGDRKVAMTFADGAFLPGF